MTHYEQTEGRLAASYQSSSAPQGKPESDQKSWVSLPRRHVPLKGEMYLGEVLRIS